MSDYETMQRIITKMKKKRKIDGIDHGMVRKNLDYSPSTGEFRWTEYSPDRCVPGSLAGTKHPRTGETLIVVNGTICRSGILAFICMGKEAPRYVKYLDGDKSNSKWNNLEASEVVVRTATKKKTSRTVKVKSIFSTCPLNPGSGGYDGEGALTKFNTKQAFFRACNAKQGEIRMWGATRMNTELVGKLHPKCQRCRQAKGSKEGRIVINLDDIMVSIDPEMGTTL